jgi:hypothetical protein
MGYWELAIGYSLGAHEMAPVIEQQAVGVSQLEIFSSRKTWLHVGIGCAQYAPASSHSDAQGAGRPLLAVVLPTPECAARITLPRSPLRSAGGEGGERAVE